MANLSDNIKYFRKQNKLTQKELAKKLKIAPTAIS
ncbi:TPA: helix-turn-helix transcriptional regulator, partial [Streptococcus pyogenes]|nr:helix-turn-helix transcriptional regulator [Streptococcus pyogenes]